MTGKTANGREKLLAMLGQEPMPVTDPGSGRKWEWSPLGMVWRSVPVSKEPVTLVKPIEPSTIGPYILPGFESPMEISKLSKWHLPAGIIVGLILFLTNQLPWK